MTASDLAAHSFRLYIAGDAMNSAHALANLQALCRSHLAGHHSIEVVDVFSDPQRALAERIFMTPTLIRLAPLPLRRVVGALSDTAILMQAAGSAAKQAERVGRPMNSMTDPTEFSHQARIAALIETLHETEHELEVLTAGQIDTVANQAGRVFLLRSAQEQLRRQEAAKQSALLNALPAHIAVLDSDGVIVTVNDAWRHFADENGLRDAGYSVGRNYLDICGSPPGAGASQSWVVAKGLRAVLAGESGGFSVEYACDSPVEPRWFMLIATPLQSGRLLGAVVMHINVSVRARAEQLTQRSTELLQAVADGTPDVVFVKDTHGRYLLCNKALADFIGRPVEQILGRDDQALYVATEAGALAGDDRTLLATGAVQTIEKWLTGVNGRRLFHSTRAPYRDAKGKVVGVIGIARDITDARLAEQALRDSNAMLDIAGRSAKVGGWTLDLSEQRLHWSELVARMHDEPLGYSPTLEQGLASYAPEHRAAIRDAIARCAASGEPYDMEVEKISATGRRFWVRTIGEAVRNAEGQIVRLQGALQDITERKVAVLQTQKLARRLSNTLESITDAFFTVDRDWRFSYINRQAERLLGRARDSMLGHILWDVYPDVLGTVIEQQYRRVMAGAAGISFEAFYPPLRMWFDIDCHPSEDGLSVYFRDVTNARTARRQLKLLEASVAQLKDIVVISEPAPDLPHGQRIVFVNDAFVRITGYTRDEVMGQSPALLDGAATDADEVARIRCAIDRFAPVNAELMSYAKDGRQYPVEVDITPVASAGEGFTHFVSVVRDISERRSSEQALHELAAGLEDRVRQRTVELEHARELSDQANRAKSSFLATMSHEIRTPMNGVIGMIDVLEESRLNSNQRDMVKTVRESAYALLAIVDDVLDFSKIEAGQLEMEHASMDVAAVVEGVCDGLCVLSEKKGVGLRVFVDPRLPSALLGDAGRLRQVLMNLVGNAIKFSGSQSRPGSVSLRALRVAAVEEGGGDALALLVTDNGVGMDAVTVSRLFSPFTQADATTTRRFGGTGLGLSISQRLVSMMGGEITVSSQPDRGATFTVRLPMVLPTADAATVLPRMDHPLAALPCLVLGASVLAGDLADYLADAGSAMLRVSSLDEALAWVHRVGPGRCVMVVADRPDGLDAALAACRAAALECPHTVLAFVVIESGRRHRPRCTEPDQTSLDAECLRRAVFLRSVAVAACLEALDEDGPAPADDDSRAAPLESTSRSATDPLILVAEDNEINQQVLSKQLALLGYRAEMVGNGMEALAQWRCGGHDLLLTDLHMPVMDGYSLAAAVRAEEGTGSRLPIIALTANALRDEELRCREAGMDGYLTKPVRLAQLKAAIDAWLPVAPPAPSEAKPPAPTRSASPPADLGVLAALVGNDPAVIQEVLGVFRANTARSALELIQAQAGGAAQTMADIAHKLKSAARAIGAERLGQICADIEAVATETPRAAALGPLTAAFEQQLRAVRSFLDTRLDGHA